MRDARRNVRRVLRGACSARRDGCARVVAERGVEENVPFRVHNRCMQMRAERLSRRNKRFLDDRPCVGAARRVLHLRRPPAARQRTASMQVHGNVMSAPRTRAQRRTHETILRANTCTADEPTRYVRRVRVRTTGHGRSLRSTGSTSSAISYISPAQRLRLHRVHICVSGCELAR